MSMLYIVPTRERPNNARELLRAWRELTWSAHIAFVVDEDDPCQDEYKEVVAQEDVGGAWVEMVPPPLKRGMVEALNLVAVTQARHYKYVGFMGDDHRPRTPHWDLLFATEFETSNNLILYGNDLVQRANLPTSVVMCSKVIQALGYMAPPTLQHLYVDNFWKNVARARIKYMENVIVEHVHPMTGQVPWDETYKTVNAGEVYERDRIEYERLQDEGLLVDDMDRIASI